jgi:hypothetical protein
MNKITSKVRFSYEGDNNGNFNFQKTSVDIPVMLVEQNNTIRLVFEFSFPEFPSTIKFDTEINCAFPKDVQERFIILNENEFLLFATLFVANPDRSIEFERFLLLGKFNGRLQERPNNFTICPSLIN